jgi:phosphoglycolate phosphatase-like HAD superfamily hydrolase
VPTAVLWDIDGTLLTTARAGIFAVEEAIRAVCGTTCDLSTTPTAGLTDYEVMELGIRLSGLTPDEATTVAVLERYEQRLPRALRRRRGSVMPGVHEILNDLAQRPHVTSLLLTGNTERGAAAKLAHYGLAGYFGMEGAFCVGPGSRVEIARRAARLTGGASPVVVGDTPIDIMCGRAIAARTVAVATGTHSSEDLAAHSPSHVVERLPAPDAFASLLRLG